jgi:hypothetical protein
MGEESLNEDAISVLGKIEKAEGSSDCEENKR